MGLVRPPQIWALLRPPLLPPPRDSSLGGGGGAPPPLPPLCPLPPRPLDAQVCRACCDVSGVWPLCGPPPGRNLIIQATMARACSSGVPLPPNGVGAPSLTLGTSWASPLTPLPPPLLRLVVGGGLIRSWGLPPISCIIPCTKGVRACSGGVCPSPLGWGRSPPP